MLALSIVMLMASLVGAAPFEIGQAGVHVGDATFYDVGMGSCGVYNVPSDFIAAVSHELYDTFPGYSGGNPNNKPICGHYATAFHQGRSIHFRVQDRCGGCAGFGDLDFSHSAFIGLFGSLDAGRVHGVRWVLDGEGEPYPRPPSPPGRSCAKTYTVVPGDNCYEIAKRFGISVETFLSLNPSINRACTNLQVGTAYCVQAGNGFVPDGLRGYYRVDAGDTCESTYSPSEQHVLSPAVQKPRSNG